MGAMGGRILRWAFWLLHGSLAPIVHATPSAQNIDLAAKHAEENDDDLDDAPVLATLPDKGESALNLLTRLKPALPYRESIVLRKGQPAPADWEFYRVPIRDTRPRRMRTHDCDAEVVKLKPKDESGPPKPAMVLVPGFFQNALLFDLDADQRLSYARHLADKCGVQVYMLHHRGLVPSCDPKSLQLDDIAIDDIPQMLEFISKDLEGGRPLHTMGLSMGGILLQSYGSGLTREGRAPDGRRSKRNVFSQKVADERAKLTKSIIAVGAHPAMTMRSPIDQMEFLAQVDRFLGPLGGLFFKHVPINMAARMTKYFFDPLTPVFRKFSPSYISLWKYFYRFDNVSPQAQKMFRDRVIVPESWGVMRQYAGGVRDHGEEGPDGVKYYGLRTRGDGKLKGESYVQNLSKMSVDKYIHVAMSNDPLADAERSLKDTFMHIGQPEWRQGKDPRYSFMLANGGHEDPFLSAAHHSDLDPAVEKALGAGSCSGAPAKAASGAAQPAG